MTARKAAHSLQRAKGALASGFATVDLHHATGHDPLHRKFGHSPCLNGIGSPISFLSAEQLISHGSRRSIGQIQRYVG